MASGWWNCRQVNWRWMVGRGVHDKWGDRDSSCRRGRHSLECLRRSGTRIGALQACAGPRPWARTQLFSALRPRAEEGNECNGISRKAGRSGTPRYPNTGRPTGRGELSSRNRHPGSFDALITFQVAAQMKAARCFSPVWEMHCTELLTTASAACLYPDGDMGRREPTSLTSSMA